MNLLPQWTQVLIVLPFQSLIVLLSPRAILIVSLFFRWMSRWSLILLTSSSTLGSLNKCITYLLNLLLPLIGRRLQLSGPVYFVLPFLFAVSLVFLGYSFFVSLSTLFLSGDVSDFSPLMDSCIKSLPWPSYHCLHSSDQGCHSKCLRLYVGCQCLFFIFDLLIHLGILKKVYYLLSESLLHLVIREPRLMSLFYCLCLNLLLCFLPLFLFHFIFTLLEIFVIFLL